MLEYSGGADFDFQKNVLCFWYNKVTLLDKQRLYFVRIRECVNFTWEIVKIYLREIGHAERQRYEQN